MVRKPAPVLKPRDWEKSSNGRQWKPQLGFNRDRRPVHLDQAAFRTLGWVVGFCPLYILLFLNHPQSIKLVFIPQILKRLLNIIFCDILMTFILYCFLLFLKFTGVPLVYITIYWLWIPLFPLKIFLSVWKLFQGNKIFSLSSRKF